jgi:hypothetical protein
VEGSVSEREWEWASASVSAWESASVQERVSASELVPALALVPESGRAPLLRPVSR